MYHHVVESSAVEPHAISLRRLEQQLDFLKRGGWQTLGLDDILRVADGTLTLSDRSVWITFDDGYSSFLDLAMPLLLARDMRATLFVVAGRIGGVNDWDISCDLPPRPLLNEAGLLSVRRAGMDIGAHGWAHRDLIACDESSLDEEIYRSRAELEERLQETVRAYAYPYGRYGHTHPERIAAAGYRIAVANRSSAHAVMANVFTMRRICMNDCSQNLRFRLKLSRAYLRYRGWRRS